RRSLSNNGSLRRWRFGGAVEANAADVPIAIDFEPVRIALDGQHRFRHNDERGNTRLVSNMAGELETLTRYGAFGESVTTGGRTPEVGFASGSHLMTSAGEIVLLGARPLDPRSGRFLNPDPLWNPLNVYAYTFGNPIEFLDESGLHPGHSDGLDDHQAIELKRIERNAAVALTVTLAGAAIASRNPAAIAAAIGAAILAIQKQAELRTLEKFHEMSFPVVIDPVLAVPPSIGPFDIPDVGWFGGGFGEGIVTICDDPDIHPC
ncbi:MAG TPA: RHS repeat-associated core domain-containing protein, partial [Myxococcota bacterium]|nr:RHS repeat-associated core domain-containing protein [Myxococcota bacterium]